MPGAWPEAARRFAGDAWPERGLVFAVPPSGPVHPIAFGIQYHNMMRASGLPGMPFRDVRADSASLLLATGVPPTAVMAIMGRATPKLALSIDDLMPAEAVRDALYHMDGLLTREGRDEGTESG